MSLAWLPMSSMAALAEPMWKFIWTARCAGQRESERRRRRIAVFDLDVDVVDAAVEGEFVGVFEGGASGGTSIGKPDHVATIAFLETRSVRPRIKTGR